MVLDDHVAATAYKSGKHETRKLRLQDKGQRGLMLRFIEAIRGTAQPAITWDDLLLSTRLTLCARESLTTGKPVAVGGE